MLKQNKRGWNKTCRYIVRTLLQFNQEVPVKIQAVSNVWDGDKMENVISIIIKTSIYVSKNSY